MIYLKTIDGSNVSFKPEMNSIERVKPKEIFKVITNDCFLRRLLINEYKVLHI